jgi:hypothetical protein
MATVKSLRLAPGHVEFLYREGFLSFNPFQTSKLTEEEFTELTFIGRLAAVLPLAPMEMMLSNLEKPYLYSHSQIYFDWSSLSWKAFPDHAELIGRMQERLNRSQRDAENREFASRSMAELLVGEYRDRLVANLKEMEAHRKDRFPNAWEELVEEVIGGKSIFWQQYLDNVRACGRRVIEKLNSEEMASLISGLALSITGRNALNTLAPDGSRELPSLRELTNIIIEHLTRLVMIVAEEYRSDTLDVIPAFRSLSQRRDCIDAARAFATALSARPGIQGREQKVVESCLSDLQLLPYSIPLSESYLCVYSERQPDESRKMQFYSILVTPKCFEIMGGGCLWDNEPVTDFRFMGRPDGRWEEVDGDIAVWLKRGVAFAPNTEWKISISDEINI